MSEAELIDEDAQCQQAVDNRRYRRQVGDVDLDDGSQPVAFGVLLKIKTGSDAERHSGTGGDQHDQQRAYPGRENARLGGAPRGKVEEEIDRKAI